jgi:hypothetical protein
MTAVCDQVGDAALRGAPATELATVFAQMIRKTVLLLDPRFGLSARAGQSAMAAPWDPAEPGIARLLRLLAAERRPLRVPPVPGSALSHGCLAMPITIGETVLGYLLVLDENGEVDPDDVDLIITSYAATLFALTLAREQTSLELGLRYQGTVVDSLVCGHFLDQHDACRKALELGLSESQPFRIAVARTSSDGLAADLAPPGDAAAQQLREMAMSARLPFVLRGPKLVMIMPQLPETAARPSPSTADETPLANFSRLLAGKETPRAEITCGLSDLITTPELAPRGLWQAEQAIELGARLGRTGQLIRYEDLGIYRLLLQIGDMSQLSRFAADVLGPLLDYDATHKVDLVATLSAYFSQHESLKQAARLLRVHVNTVAYRVQRVQQLTALDLANPEDRLLAHVAVKIVEAHSSDGARNLRPGLAGRESD